MTAAQPLTGVKVLELAGLGPVPFATMMLADLGADVVRIDRPGRFDVVRGGDPLTDGKRIVTLDLKDPEAVEQALGLIRVSDVLVEGFRPGVMERLGLGPDECLDANPSLLFVRVDGWGRHFSDEAPAGHDINFLARLGLLDMIGTEQQPVPPLNLVADFGGGGMSAVVGILSALVARGARDGAGSVIQTSLFEGAAYLAAMLCGQAAQGDIRERGANLLDGGHPLYRAYETSDGEWLAVGALEPVFAQRFLEVLGLSELAESLSRRAAWPGIAERVAAVVRSRSQADWQRAFARPDACVMPSRTFAAAIQDDPFYEAGDHRRPRLPLRFGGEHGPGLEPEQAITLTEVLRRWG